MRRLRIDTNAVMMGHYRTVLEGAGIGCLIKNEHLRGAMGELPPTECWPELWILDDNDAEEAQALLDGLVHQPFELEPWTCPRCNEVVEPPLTECWNCSIEPDSDGKTLIA
jgi:hypothetical protein